MATDGPNPTPCSDDLYIHGAIACNCITDGANAFEAIIVSVRERLKVEVDWHYVGGVAVVRCWEKDRAAVCSLVMEACKALKLTCRPNLEA